MTFFAPPPIDSARLQLRLVEAYDIEGLMAINGDPEVTRFLPYQTWQSVKDGKVWFERMCELMEEGDMFQFVICGRQSGQILGTCLLFRYDKLSARAEIGYVIGRAHWQKGFAFEAVSALINYAFAVYKLRRLEAEVDPANLPSNQLLCKLGFQLEGRLRQRWYSKQGHYDTHIYGLLKHEWQHEGSAD